MRSDFDAAEDRRERINRVKVSRAGAHKMAALSLADRIAGLRGAARRCRNAYPSDGPWRDACHLLAEAYEEAAAVLGKLQLELELE